MDAGGQWMVGVSARNASNDKRGQTLSLRDPWSLYHIPYKRPTSGRAEKTTKIAMPVHTLPLEILSATFESGLVPYADFDESVVTKREEYLSTVCLVSALWKDVAYQTPQLWSLLKVDYDLEDPAARNIKPYYRVQCARLDRAKGVPLDIILFGSSPSRSTPTSRPFGRREFWRFWKLVTEKSEQWRSLLIYGVHLNTMDETEDLFPPLLPNLIEVKSRLSTSFPQPPVSSAVCLSSYHCHTNFFPFTSAETLRTLHITGVFGHALPILELGTNLHTLHLRDLAILAPIPLEGIHLPALEMLFATRTSVLIVHYILTNSFVAPKLHTLSYEVTSFPTPLSYPDSTVSIPSLKTIQLSGMHVLQLDDIGTLISKFANLRSINIHFVEFDFMISRSAMDRKTFNAVDETIRLIEEKVARVTWSPKEAAVDDDGFGTWPEARVHFGI